LFGLSLVAILSATPSRQAEAADDFARSMAELGEGNRVEEVDGGVGDDSLEALRIDANEARASLAITPESSDFKAWLGPILPDSVSEPDRSRLGVAVISRLSARSSRRQAWLQRFLF